MIFFNTLTKIPLIILLATIPHNIETMLAQVEITHPYYHLIKNYKQLMDTNTALPTTWLTNYCLYESPFLLEPKILCQFQIVLAEFLVLFNRNPTQLLEMNFDSNRDWFSKLSYKDQQKVIQTYQLANEPLEVTIDRAYINLPLHTKKSYLITFAQNLGVMYANIREAALQIEKSAI